MIHIVSDVFLVREDLMHGAPRPRPVEIRDDCSGVQGLGDFTFGFSVGHKYAVDLAHNFLLRLWPRHLSFPAWSINIRRRPKPAAPPCLNPSWISRHAP